MVFISIIALAVHVLVAIRAFMFIRASHGFRDTDRALVAGAGALSALFVVAQLYTGLTDPQVFLSTRAVIRVGFDASVAIVFLCIVHHVSDACDRRERAS